MRIPLTKTAILADKFRELDDDAIREELKSATIPEMSLKGKEGATAYHIAAQKHIVVPNKLLNELVLSIKDYAGDTPLHYYAKWPLISLLPHKWINDKTLFVKNARLRTPYHEFAGFQNFCVVPENLKTLGNLLMPDDAGRTPLHEAASCCCIEMVPSPFLTQEVLTTTSRDGTTVFHCLVAGDCLDKIPQHLVTRENLTIRNKAGQIPLHLGSLRTVPKHLLTREIMLLESNRESDKGWNVMHHAVELDGFKYIPKELLTLELLTLKTKDTSGVLPQDCLYLAESAEVLSELPVYNEFEAASMIASERSAWATALAERDLPVPEHLTADWAPVSKEGAWQEL